MRISDIKNKYTGNTTIIIEYKKFRQFVYKAQPSRNIMNFFCDLGGIFGLYFGIALMDFNKIFEFFLKKLKEIINSILIYDKLKFIVKFKRHFVKIKIFILYLGKIRWNILIYAISAPILFTQLFTIIYTYFQYTTETTYEFIPYIRNDNRYSVKQSVNEFPAITVCNENLFEKIIFGKHYDIDQVEYLLSLYDQLNKDNRLNIDEDIKEIYILSRNRKTHLLRSRDVEALQILWTNYTQDIRLLMTLTDYINYYSLFYSKKENIINDKLPIFSGSRFNRMSNDLVNLFGALNHSDFKARVNRFENKHTYGLKTSPTIDPILFRTLQMYCQIHSAFYLFQIETSSSTIVTSGQMSHILIRHIC